MAACACCVLLQLAAGAMHVTRCAVRAPRALRAAPQQLQRPGMCSACAARTFDVHKRLHGGHERARALRGGAAFLVLGMHVHPARAGASARGHISPRHSKTSASHRAVRAH